MSLFDYCRDECIDMIIGDMRGKRLLDVGCGDGVRASDFMKKGASVTGIDIVDYRQRRDFRFARISAHDLAQRERDKYDAILAVDVIEHVEHPASFIDELLTLLAPSGVIVLTTPNRLRPANLLTQPTFPRYMGNERGTECWHLREYTKRELRALLGKYAAINGYWLGLGPTLGLPLIPVPLIAQIWIASIKRDTGDA